MNHPFKFAFLFLVITLPGIAQQPVFVDKTELTEVKIYTNGAYVSRSAKTILNAGINEVVFKGLSPYIDPKSVTVKGKGDATLLNVSFKQDYLKDRYKSKEIVNLEGLLDSLNYKYQQVLNTASILKEKESLLLANKSIGGANNGVLADELEPVMDYFSAKLTEIKEEQLTNSVKDKKVREQIEKVKNELTKYNQLRNQPEGNIVVQVNANAKGAAAFEFAYMINQQASWYSFYDVKAKDVTSPVEVIYKAKVMQNTGENWEHTKLRLSTANPQAGNVKPDIYPWYLNFIVPQTMVLQGLNKRYINDVAPRSSQAITTNEMASIPVSITESQLSTEFSIAIPYTIMSDGKEYQIEIQSFSLPAVFEYVALPKVDADAFLTARIAGWEDLNLTPGSANIYFDGAYIGESYINPLSTGDTLALSLGRDKKIVIKREKLKELSSTRFLGSTKERAFTYEISVRNTKKESMTLVVEDQVPISQDKEIEVKIDELSGGIKNEETGKVFWKITLQPNETKKIKFAFAVKYPKNKMVNGL